MSRILYILACGAPPACDVGILAVLAQQRGWDVCVVTSARGRTFVDPAALEAMTGHPVRSEYKNPGEPEVLALDLAGTSHEPQVSPAARRANRRRQMRRLRRSGCPRPSPGASTSQLFSAETSMSLSGPQSTTQKLR